LNTLGLSEFGSCHCCNLRYHKRDLRKVEDHNEYECVLCIARADKFLSDHAPDATRYFSMHIPKDRVKVASDGSTTEYYSIPDHATELRHLISAKAMSKSRGDIFKACYRLGEKEGTDTLYDLNKMKFFIQDLIEMHSRGEHL